MALHDDTTGLHGRRTRDGPLAGLRFALRPPTSNANFEPQQLYGTEPEQITTERPAAPTGAVHIHVGDEPESVLSTTRDRMWALIRTLKTNPSTHSA